MSKNQKPITDEIATIQKDIDIYAGWLKRLENPDPVLRSEAAGKGLKLYDEVERDAHAGSVLQQRALSVVGKEWEIMPAKTGRKNGRMVSSEQDQIVADYVSDVLDNCNFDQARQEILKAILYGYYVAEIMWTVDRQNNVETQDFASLRNASSQIKIKKIIGKHPRRFLFTPERELRLLTLSDMVEGEQLPDKKFIVFTYGDSDNPYGKGLGQKLWWPVWFKKNGIKFWLIFLEKFGAPTPKGKYPVGSTKEQKDTLLAVIETIQTDIGITMPDTMDVEFLEASRAGTVSYEQLCEYMDRQISKAALGQTATTEGTPGKLGNDVTQQNTKQELVEADADLLDGCLNDNLIRWIVDYNFSVTAYPKIKTYAGAKPDLRQQSEIDKTLVVDIGLPVGKRYFYETYGIPEPEEGEDLVMVKQPSVETQNLASLQNGKQPQFAEAANAFEQDFADIIANRLGIDGMKVAEDTLMAPIKKLLDQSKDLAEFKEKITDLYSELDPANLGALIGRAMFMADITGRYEVQGERGKVQGE